MSIIRRRDRLLTRLLLALMPVGILPLAVFGYLAIDLHFTSIEHEALKNHRAVSRLLAKSLDDELAKIKRVLANAPRREALRSSDLETASAGVRAVAEAVLRRNPEQEVTYYLLDASGAVLLAEPPQSEIRGKRLALEFGKPDESGVSVSGVTYGNTLEASFWAGVIVANAGAQSRGLVAEISLGPWARAASSRLSTHDGMIVALVPVDSTKGKAVSISQGDPQIWEKVAEIRARPGASPVQNLQGKAHFVTYEDLRELPSRLVVAEPLDALYASPRRLIATFAGTLGVLIIAMALVIFVIARGMVRPIQQMLGATRSYAEGGLKARVSAKREDEIGQLASAFNEMGRSLDRYLRRNKVLHRSLQSLFECETADDVLGRGVELACTQVGAEVASFAPHEAGNDRPYANGSVFLGLHAWLWKNHRLLQVSPREAADAWTRQPGDRVFRFPIRSQGKEIGILIVAYRTAPDEAVESLLNTVVALVESSIAKLESIRERAVISTELTMAEAVQRTVLADNVRVCKQARLAYHYQPASRLSGDWFYLIENQSGDALYVVMGDVTGQGLAQGLVTTAVKGAIDVLASLLERSLLDEKIRPGVLMAQLERVVRRAAGKSELAMTCLIARIDFTTKTLTVCNAGHTFPILMRNERGVMSTRRLHEKQQAYLGGPAEPRDAYDEAEYGLKDGDILLVYTDGLTDARNLKSDVFGRFLFRTLRKRRDYTAPEDLRDEILEMFRYYTQGTVIEDDVCFLVLQMKPMGIASARKLDETA